MPLIAKNTGGDRVEQPALEPKAYPARLVRVITLGLQPQLAWEGQKKDPIEKIDLTYELSDEFMVDANGDIQEDKPRWVSKTMPFYGLGAEKSNIARHYKGLDPTDACEGDWEKLLGMPCQVTLTKELNKKKKLTNYISDVTGPVSVKGYVQPPLVNDPTLFDVENPDIEMFNGFPAWLKERIQSHLKYNGSVLQGLLGEAPAPVANDPHVGNAAPPAPPAPDVPQ